MIRTILIATTLLLTACVKEQTAAQVYSVYDGDTITVIIPPSHEKVRVRLMGFDTAERKGANCPAEAEQAELQRLALTDLVGDNVYLSIEGIDRYGRTLAWVYTEDGQDVSNIMIQEYQARPYSGGKRQSWCES